MNIYVIVDMEGMAGLVDNAAEASSRGKDYELWRRLLSKEVAAIAEGLNDGGARQIVIADFHGSGRNLLFDVLPVYVDVVRGGFRAGSGTDGAGMTVDGLVFAGCHAASHTAEAVICHTYSGDMRVTVNGRAVNEYALLAAAWGENGGVPPILFSGDEAACRQVTAFTPSLRTVVTKYGLGFTAARCPHPERVAGELRKAARLAMADIDRNMPFLFDGGAPYDVQIELPQQPWADRLSWIPGARRAGDNAYTFTIESAQRILDLVYGICMLRP